MSEKITFEELTGRLSGRAKRSRRFTREFVRELAGIIESGLRTSGSVSISGFGKFELRWMDERKGINPQTGEEILIDGRNKVVFKPYKSLRDRVLGETSRTSGGKQTGISSPDGNLDDILTIKPSPVRSAHKSSAIHPSPHPANTGADTSEEVLPEPMNQKQKAEAVLSVPRSSQKDARAVLPEPEALKQDSSLPMRAGKRPVIWSGAAAAVVLLLLFLIWWGEHATEPESFANRLSDTPALAEADAAGAQVLRNSGNDSAAMSAATGSGPTDEAARRTIRIEHGQTLWSLAGTNLGDPYLWPWIYHLNPQIHNPNAIRAGMELTLPDPASKGNLSDRDLREVAEGYIKLYHRQREQGFPDARYFLWAAGTYSPDLLEEMNPAVDPADLIFARNP